MGHRKIWARVRHDGQRLSPSTVLRIVADEGLLVRVDYCKQLRELAKQRKAAFAAPPTGPNQVWQFDFSEYETTGGGTWRVAGVELALAEAEAMLDGVSLVDHHNDPATSANVPITLVTDKQSQCVQSVPLNAPKPATYYVPKLGETGAVRGAYFRAAHAGRAASPLLYSSILKGGASSFKWVS